MRFNWKKFSVVAAAGAAFLASALVVFSQQPQEPPRPRMGPPGGFGHGHGLRGPRGFGMLHGLNLTDAQKEQIKQIHESFGEQTRALHDQMRTLHEDRSNPMSSTFDEASVRSAAEARAKLQVELDVLHAKMMSQVASVLTPEQRAQLAERRKHKRPMGPPKPPTPPGEPEL